MNLSPIIRQAIAPLWARHEKSPYLAVARSLKESEQVPLEERGIRQWQKLTNLIEHAWNQSPYYRKRFSSVGFNPGDLKQWKDFQSLPVLSKEDIAGNIAELISRTSKRENLQPRKTSGSTGVNLNFYVDEAEFQYKRGVQLYRDQWTGWKLGEWKALVWGNPTYLYSLRGRFRNLLLERHFSLDTLKMDEAMMDSFASEIFRRKPTMLFGHAHSLYLFACFWRRRGLPVFRFQGILSTAMVLHKHERNVCESVFETPVFDRYGCEEVSLIASECEKHEGLHVNTDSLIVEVMKDDRPARAGETGGVFVTDLCNRAMPFIRYEVGDTAVPSDQTCSCGRTYPLLKRITGRVADYLRTPEGEWISGISLTENFATLIPGLHQIQILQEEPDFLRLRAVRGLGFDDGSIRLMAELVQQRFGSRMRFVIDYVDSIKPEASGKYRFSIYKVGASASD
jgi:phenylacetate-CoA ligase